MSCYGLNAFANNKMLPASRDPRIKRCSEAFDSHKELYSKQTCTIPGVQSCNQNRGHVPRRIDPRLAKANRNSTRDSGFVPVRSHTHAQQPNPTKKTGVTGVEKKYIKNEVCIPQTEQIRQTSLHESYLCNQNYPALHESVVDFHCYPGTLPGHSRGGFSNTQWPGGFGPQNNNVITERVASNKTNHFRQDLPRTIPIDGIQREIRFYGEQAVVLIADDDPRLLGFMPGWRRVFLNDAVVNLATCGDYEEFVFNGRTHKIKIGTPTREVYIDGAW